MQHANEGSRLLNATDVPQATIAAAVGASQGAVSRWLSGARKPAREAREALLAAYRIPVDAWDRSAAPAGSPLVPPVPAATPLVPFGVPPATADEPGYDWSQPDSVIRAAKANCEALRLAAESTRYDGPTRAKFRGEYRRAMLDLAKLARELTPIEESQMTKTATFARFCQRLIDALRPFPDATAAVLVALGADLEGNQ